MIKRTQVIEFRNGKQVLSELHKLLVTITISMSFPEWLDHQAILWIHYKISPEIIKHYSISRIIELQIPNENKSLLTAHCQLDSWKKNQSICKDVIFLSERPLLFYANGCFCNNLQVPIQKEKKQEFHYHRNDQILKEGFGLELKSSAYLWKLCPNQAKWLAIKGPTIIWLNCDHS